MDVKVGDIITADASSSPIERIMEMVSAYERTASGAECYTHIGMMQNNVGGAVVGEIVIIFQFGEDRFPLRIDDAKRAERLLSLYAEDTGASVTELIGHIREAISKVEEFGQWRH